jgi:hypothetical protein
VSFIVFQFLVTVSLFVIMKIYLLHRRESPKHKNLWWHEGPLNYQKFVLRNTAHFIRSSKKSFLRERSVSFLLKSRSKRECRAYSEKSTLIPLKVKGEEAPKGGLQRKVNADSAESKRRRSS